VKVEELVGKLAIRIGCRRESGSGSAFLMTGVTYDSSYTTEPIKIEEIVNGIVFYRERPLGQVKVLSPLYRDEVWAEFPERLAEKWPADTTQQVVDKKD
jgi:hypothetical protein